MSSTAVTYQADNHIATITLNRVEHHNTLTGELVEALFEALNRAQTDGDIWVAILTAAGDKDFCLGADMKETDGFPSRSLTKAIKLNDPINPAQTWIQKVREFDKPLICAINGRAVGGGLGLAFCCDILIAAENASFGCGFAFNLYAALDGVNYHLPRFLPWHKACDFAFGGEVIGAKQAEELGMINKVVPYDQLAAAARRKAENMCRMAPLGLRAAKRYMWEAYNNNLQQSLIHSEVLAGAVQQSEDFKEAMDAFSSGRQPEFKGK